MDLNICVETDGSRDTTQKMQDKVDRCRELGFHTIALSVSVDATSGKKDMAIPPPPDKKMLVSSLKIYTRLTVKVSASIQLNYLNANLEAKKYDLIALEPQNGKILLHIATEKPKLDILTFNLNERLESGFFKVRFKLLEQLGVCTEINYGPAQSGSALRRNIICNGQSLIEKTWKNVILSNGVDDVFRLRGPKDAMSIGVLFMIPPKRCHDTVYKNGLKALECAESRVEPTASAIKRIKLAV